jgi:hypothetical protein
LSSAVGLIPFKDVFWSSSNQPENPYGQNCQEAYSALNAVISTLTSGPVGPGDKIGEQFMNRTLIMRLYIHLKHNFLLYFY